jgi:hypothetical protein
MAMSLGFNINFLTARVLIVCINLPIMLIGLQGFNIASIFLISNMITTCCTFPIAFGLLEYFDLFLDSSAVLFSCLFGLTGVLLYGVIMTGSLVEGLYTYFYFKYDAGAFLVGSLGSILAVFLWRGLMSLKKSFDFVPLENSEKGDFPIA